MNQPVLESVSTAFGPVAIVWWAASSGPRIRQIFLCGQSMPGRIAGSIYPGIRPGSCPEVESLGRRIRCFLDGEDVVFDLNSVALEACGEFQRAVLLAEYAIPRGRVSTYGRIARHIGSPGAGRAVGRALATNPFPIVIPCHRALRADGAIGGYQGGANMKRALLAAEGVKFAGSGKVNLNCVFY